jgi:FAD/FMN-containing dehydrogenase
VGGAIANDIHGKNHHIEGTFGRHVISLELLRSDGTRQILTPGSELFSATIGGLGLTGLITQATFRLIKIPGPLVSMNLTPFKGLEHFFTLSETSKSNYTVSWVDCLSKTPRGIFMEGEFIAQGEFVPQRKVLTFPCYAPSFLLNSLSIQIFNELYFQRIPSKGTTKTVSLNPFFYPLDSINNWNKMYGREGFLQWQCVVPKEGIGEIFSVLRKNRAGSFLAVLKTFGDISSPGLLSFPRPGVTLALDFPIRGLQTFKVLDMLDSVVKEHKGALYPAKDARMSKEIFSLSFPKLEQFKKFVDPHFSSSFWRRVVQ